MRKTERTYLSELRINIEDYCEEHNDITYEILCDEFGSPSDVLNSYLSNMDMNDIIRRINISRIIRVAALVIIIAMISVSLVHVMHIQEAYEIFAREEAVFIDYEISDN